MVLPRDLTDEIDSGGAYLLLHLGRRSAGAETDAQIAVFRFIEGFYDASRRHSSIGYLSPAEFEAAHRSDRAWMGAPKPETCPSNRVNSGRVPDHSTFTENRHGRFRESDLMGELIERVVGQCLAKGLADTTVVAVDGTNITASASKEHFVRVAEELPHDGREPPAPSFTTRCPINQVPSARSRLSISTTDLSSARSMTGVPTSLHPMGESIG